VAPRPDPPPRDIRRRGARKAGRRTSAPDPQLVAAFEAGEYRRGDFAPGTAARKAADAVLYRRREASRQPGQRAREAAGHEPREIRSARRVSVFIGDPPRYAEYEGLSRRDVSRAAKYDALVSNLRQGNISPQEFRRRVSAWQPIAGERFLADPDAVLTIVEERRAAGEDLFVYRSGRAA
jgi:hypothetical protein